MTDFISMSIKTDGKLKKISRNLKNLDDKAMRRTAEQIRREMKKNMTAQKIHGKTGDLQRSVTVQRVNRMHYRIGPTKEYAKWVNSGTGIYPPGGQGEISRPGGGLMRWEDKHGEVHFAYTVLGQPGRQFLEQTYARSKPQVNNWYNTYLMKELNKILTGAGGQSISLGEAP